MSLRNVLSCYAWGLCLLLVGLAGCGDNVEEDLREVLQQHLQAEEGSYGDVLQSFYAKRGHAPVWVEPDGVRTRTDTLLVRLCESGREGLSSAAYHLPEIEQALQATYIEGPEADSLRARMLAELELALSRAFLTYAGYLAHGRVSPETVAGVWRVQKQPVDLLNVLGEGVGPGGLDHTFRKRTSQNERYVALRDALMQYHKIAADGGWPRVPSGPPLQQGATGDRVVALRQRLAITGDLRGSATDATFDGAVEEAVRRFQQRHGMESNGVVDEPVLAALNIPVEVRIDYLTLNLERLRWMPDRLGEEHMLVNIPAFDLHAYRGSEDVLAMQVIVGQRMNQTPVFSDTITYVVFNPYWNIPQSIAEDEILPKVQDDRSHLARQGYQIVRDFSPDAQVYDPYTTDLGRVASGELQLRQAPGPQNPLGRVKLMFPNDFNVYLHDTPADHLFSQAERGFSHGCIRVERPVDLVTYALEANGDWSRNRVEQTMHGGETQQVDLARPIPVHIVYLTAWVDKQGTVQFRDDLYGHDATLLQVLQQDMPELTSATCASIRRMVEEAEI